MSEDLTAVIAGAVSDAGLSETSSPDPGTGEDTSPDISGDESPDLSSNEGDSIETQPDTEADISASDPADEAVEAPIEKSQIDQDLEALGLRAPKEGERENRLPHSRVKKIAENYGKKVEARFTQEISTLKTENQRLSKSRDTMRNIDKLIETDPDRFMAMMSAVHPGKFDKYLGNAKATPQGQAKPAGAPSALGPRPQPDVVFPDKSRGYSPEQHDKLLEWVELNASEKAEQRAIASVEAKMEAKYGKMYKDHEQREALAQEIPRVQAVVQGIHETWGKDLVEKHEAEIVALMQQYPDMPTAEATARILVPKVRADRNTQRTALIKETKTRTAAAAKLVPGRATAGADDHEPESLEDVIRQAVARSRR